MSSSFLSRTCSDRLSKIETSPDILHARPKIENKSDEEIVDMIEAFLRRLDVNALDLSSRIIYQITPRDQTDQILASISEWRGSKDPKRLIEIVFQFGKLREVEFRARMKLRSMRRNSGESGGSVAQADWFNLPISELLSSNQISPESFVPQETPVAFGKSLTSDYAARFEFPFIKIGKSAKTAYYYSYILQDRMFWFDQYLQDHGVRFSLYVTTNSWAYFDGRLDSSLTGFEHDVAHAREFVEMESFTINKLNLNEFDQVKRYLTISDSKKNGYVRESFPTSLKKAPLESRIDGTIFFILGHEMGYRYPIGMYLNPKLFDHNVWYLVNEQLAREPNVLLKGLFSDEEWHWLNTAPGRKAIGDRVARFLKRVEMDARATAKELGIKLPSGS